MSPFGNSLVSQIILTFIVSVELLIATELGTFLLAYPIIMSMPPEIEEARPSYHPLFGDDEADIILSSNDQTLFRLPSITLRKSSNYFRNHIQFNESTSPSQQPHFRLPFPTLPTERVLCLISGLPLSTSIEQLSLQEMESMLGVIQFLDAPGPLSTLRSYLFRRDEEEPVLVYGLAVKWGWNEIAQKAAERTLSIIDIFSSSSSSFSQLEQLPTASSFIALYLMHQRRKDQFRHHLQDRSQFQLTCRLCCDPTYWRLLTTKLIDELNQDCSGKSILSPGGIEEWSETRSCWKGSPCRDGRCDYRHGLANKKLTMKKIRAVVENLPKDLNFKI